MRIVFTRYMQHKYYFHKNLIKNFLIAKFEVLEILKIASRKQIYSVGRKYIVFATNASQANESRDQDVLTRQDKGVLLSFDEAPQNDMMEISLVDTLFLPVNLPERLDCKSLIFLCLSMVSKLYHPQRSVPRIHPLRYCKRSIRFSNKNRCFITSYSVELQINNKQHVLGFFFFF